MYSIRAKDLGSDVGGIIKLKDKILSLAEEMKVCRKEEILNILQRELPANKIQDF